MRKIFVFAIFVLVMTCLLSGCSRQSVTDFTPYPAQQGTALLYISLKPLEFTLSDGSQVHISTAAARIISVSATNPESLIRTSIRAHAGHDEEEHESSHSSSEENATLNDPNRDTPDERPLVPTTFNVAKPIDLLKGDYLGSLHLRAGTTTGLSLSFAPDEMASFSLYLSGEVKIGTISTSLSVEIEEPFDLTFNAFDPVNAEQINTFNYELNPTSWFEGLEIGKLVASGPIFIDHEHHDLMHKFLDALTGEHHEHASIKTK